MTAFSQVVPKSYADFKRFWELAQKVRNNIRNGLTSEQAKAEASEMFNRAGQELSYQQERNEPK